MNSTMLRIPAVPLSANRLQRMHWCVKKRERARLAKMLMVAAIESGLVLNPDVVEKKDLVIHYYLPRRYDKDNAEGGVKLLIDAMRDIGLVSRDSLRWLNQRVEQHLSKKRYTVVEVKRGEP